MFGINKVKNITNFKYQLYQLSPRLR